MASVIEQLNHVILGAVKRGATDSANMYKTFKAELILKFGKEPTWEDAAKLAKNQISNYEKAEVEAAEKGLQYTKPFDEIEFLKEFIPAQLTEYQIREFMRTKFEDGLTNKGLLMKALKEQFGPTNYDGKLAAQIAGEFNKTDKVS